VTNFLKTVKFTILIIWLILISITCLCGQPDYKVYKFSEDIQADINRDTMPWKYQIGATNYSFIENYAVGLAAWNMAVKAKNYKPTATDTAILIKKVRSKKCQRPHRASFKSGTNNHSE